MMHTNDANLNDLYTSRFIKQQQQQHNDSTTRTSVIQDKINKNNRFSNKSNYSSQEDFLSSMVYMNLKNFKFNFF